MRRVGAALLAIVGIVSLAGCSAPPPPDPAAVQQWMQEQGRAADGANLGSMVSVASPTEAVETAMREGREEGVRFDFDDTPRLEAVDVACFGAAEMTITVQLLSAPQTQVSQWEVSQSDVACGDESTRIDLPQAGGQTYAVVVNGHNPHGFGAWAATLR